MKVNWNEMHFRNTFSNFITTIQPVISFSVALYQHNIPTDGMKMEPGQQQQQPHKKWCEKRWRDSAACGKTISRWFIHVLNHFIISWLSNLHSKSCREYELNVECVQCCFNLKRPIHFQILLVWDFYRIWSESERMRLRDSDLLVMKLMKRCWKFAWLL